LLLNDGNVDPRFLDGLVGRKLDPSLMELASPIVFRSGQQGERAIGSFNIGRRNLRNHRELSHVRMMQRTLGDSVFLAPTVLFFRRHKPRLAFDAL
jgi:hypothetical protein